MRINLVSENVRVYTAWTMNLNLLPETFSICRLEPTASPPQKWFALTRTSEELSVVCVKGGEPGGAKIEHDWRALKVEGPLDFALTGILSELLNPLAQARISIFALSTFDTDYILVRSEKLSDTLSALKNSGHTIT